MQNYFNDLQRYENVDFFTHRINRRHDWTVAGRVSSFVSMKLVLSNETKN